MHESIHSDLFRLNESKCCPTDIFTVVFCLMDVEESMHLDSPPAGPQPENLRNTAVLLRENALLSIMLVVKWHTSRSQLFVQLASECRQLQYRHYIEMKLTSSGEFDYLVTSGPSRTDSWFILKSISLIERYLAWVLSAGRTPHMTPCLFWAVLECMRFSLWTHAHTRVRLERGECVAIAGHDDDWFKDRAYARNMTQWDDFHGIEFESERISALYGRYLCECRDEIA